MFNTPSTPTADNQPELFDLAAQVLGCDPVDLLKVRQQDGVLIIILATGQKFTFDITATEAELGQAIRAQLADVLHLAPEPAPAPEPEPSTPADKPPARRKAK